MFSFHLDFFSYQQSSDPILFAGCEKPESHGVTMGPRHGWQLEFLNQIGLEDLAIDDYAQIGGINSKNG
ncbi:hypothetical protein ACN38_g8989 [Penicillium nordicum]|uniref:Uncharacterized protein n=1 Tax=Penicillium nordicum TaxID=229535 RepID=A0A0M8P3W1_9EURO|nr:hypothetical protein ACN38_g8989 [Penicillium nordicum]